MAIAIHRAHYDTIGKDGLELDGDDVSGPGLLARGHEGERDAIIAGVDIAIFPLGRLGDHRPDLPRAQVPESTRKKPPPPDVENRSRRFGYPRKVDRLGAHRLQADTARLQAGHEDCESDRDGKYDDYRED